ncbi:hypothetical protein FGO68_gene5802 [Halteria grandinella]|uniref:Peptidase M20 dimerisation domain-containing protein n=1 Tax=Halteria grandinella TaxID=5974 RepID=A0A8J8NPX8_HALGN|nr:hypothetical protein FGO68_gene5802 [Halteria grandinella]
MREAGCDLDRMVEIRHWIHQNAETAFKEVNTSQKIRETLISYGLKEEDIRCMAVTGLVVDIEGTGPKQEEGGVQVIALRADMDALPMPENNPDLPYKTLTGAAHMCGHDGHMATLLAATQVLMKHREKIPTGKKVRLLFQPAEEGTGGAKPMIKEGCLDGVEEVYGYHNIPNFDEGDIRVISGPIMASSSMVTIKIKGQGGHGSVPHMLKDVISCGAAVISNFLALKSRMVDSKENCIFSITKFDSGFTYNVFPDEATILGTIRTYNPSTLATIHSKLKQIIFNTVQAFGCTAELDINDKYPPTVNHPRETDHVIRLATVNFGSVKSEGLPMTAAEDFSYYLQERPGCFFMLGTQKAGENYVLHTSHFDYNDSMIASGALMFVRIVEDRLGAKILAE